MGGTGQRGAAIERLSLVGEGLGVLLTALLNILRQPYGAPESK